MAKSTGKEGSERTISRVLVIDDTEIIRTLLVDVLRTDGYDVKHADNGIDAVKMAESTAFDLVFTDMHMPKQNGLATARKLNEINSKTMVIVTDSYPDKLEEVEMHENIVGTICKPFDLTELRSLLNRVEQLAAKRGEKSQEATPSQATLQKY
jgi:DNA-binding NtrC family response regulator